MNLMKKQHILALASAAAIFTLASSAHAQVDEAGPLNNVRITNVTTVENNASGVRSVFITTDTPFCGSTIARLVLSSGLPNGGGFKQETVDYVYSNMLLAMQSNAEVSFSARGPFRGACTALILRTGDIEIDFESGGSSTIQLRP